MPEWKFMFQPENGGDSILPSPQYVSWEPGSQLVLQLTEEFKNAKGLASPFIKVTPVQEGEEWSGEYLDFFIRFQLVGTGPAMKIREGFLAFDETAQIEGDERHQAFTADLTNPAAVPAPGTPRKESQSVAADASKL